MLLLALAIACQLHDMDDTAAGEPPLLPASNQSASSATSPGGSSPAGDAASPGGAHAVMGPVFPVVFPQGEVVVRDCYGKRYGDASRKVRSPGRSGMGAGATRYEAAPSAAPVPTRSAANKTEAPSMATVGSQAASGPPAVADYASASAPPAQEEASATASRALDQEALDRSSTGASASAGESRASRESTPTGPVADWGAKFYLSNDDSMSLASAQRLLFAVDQGIPYQVSQVRPHELLNYFSFDTEPVPQGQLFSVKASARQTTGDSLALALAIQGANPPRLPLDLTLVLDRSGSMAAEGRMEYTRRGLQVMTGSLRRGDRVDMVLFDQEVCVPLENYVVGRDDPSLLERAIADLEPRGSTDLDAGLKEGYRIATSRVPLEQGLQRNRRVMVLTDAFLNTGDVNTDTVSQVGMAYEEQGIRLTGIGVGRQFNDTMLDKLTEKGKGAYVYLGSEAVVDRVFGLGFESLTRTIAHDVRISLDLPPSLAMERFYGEEASKVAEDIQPINYYAGTSQLFLQDLKIREGKVRPGAPFKLTIAYQDAVTGKPASQDFSFTLGQALEADGHNVDKARALMAWTDLLLAGAMGADPCGQPLGTYAELASSLGDDAEIAYVNGLVKRTCNVDIPVAPATHSRRVSYKVKLDSDIPIAEVVMACGTLLRKENLSMGENVAVFQLPPGPCTMSFQGQVPMSTQVQVPETGGSLRCLVRGGRLSCS